MNSVLSCCSLVGLTVQTFVIPYHMCPIHYLATQISRVCAHWCCCPLMSVALFSSSVFLILKLSYTANYRQTTESFTDFGMELKRRFKLGKDSVSHYVNNKRNSLSNTEITQPVNSRSWHRASQLNTGLLKVSILTDFCLCFYVNFL